MVLFTISPQGDCSFTQSYGLWGGFYTVGCRGTPEQAKAYYKSLDPAQQKSLKQQILQIKDQIDSVPGLMDKLKALYKTLRGL